MPSDRARARDLGIVPGGLPAGQHDAITDVAGILVGHTTIIQGTDIRTGVTAVVPEYLTRPAPARQAPAGPTPSRPGPAASQPSRATRASSSWPLTRRWTPASWAGSPGGRSSP